MEKNNIRKMEAGLFTILMITIFFSSLAVAQTGSLAVWENIADGTLTSTWLETGGSDWTAQNASSVCSYNVTSMTLGVAVNGTIIGDRWYSTFEVTANDAEDGIMSIQTIDISGACTSYYAIIYYLDFNATGPECYLIYNNDGTVRYWNGINYETNVSNATDLSGDCEVDYYNTWCRVKSLWNWNQATDDGNFSVRFKIWNPSSDEPIYWMVDDTFPYYLGADDTDYYNGIGHDARWDLDPATMLFRRIFFWNLSYDLYAPRFPIPDNQIVCPTISANDMYVTYADYMDIDDLWNQTQVLKTFFNLWDLDTLYTEDFWGNVYNQNDTVYHFSIMVTDARAFFEDWFGPGIPDDFPDNILFMQTYLCPDGSQNETDFMLLRIDADNNGYDANDYAIWSNDTEQILYQGWTPFTDPYFANIFSGPFGPGDFGEVFRGSNYYGYITVINWDKIYNGTSDERVGSDLCRMSINWYDEDTDSFLCLADFDESNDTTPFTPTDNNNWQEYNTTDNWIYFLIDESISGEPMADPEDPYVAPSGVTIDKDMIMEMVSFVIQIALISFFIGVSFGLLKKIKI